MISLIFWLKQENLLSKFTDLYEILKIEFLGVSNDWLLEHHFKIQINTHGTFLYSNYETLKSKNHYILALLLAAWYDNDCIESRVANVVADHNGKEKNRKSGIRTFQDLPDFRTGCDVRLSPMLRPVRLPSLLRSMRLENHYWGLQSLPGS